MLTLRAFVVLFFAICQHDDLAKAINVEIIAWRSPPYAYDDDILQKTENITNHMLHTLTGVARYACYCRNLSLSIKFQSYADFMAHLDGINKGDLGNETFQIFLPAYKDSVVSKPYLFGHVGIVKSPGMTLVGNGFFKSKLYQLAVIGFKNVRTFLVIMVMIMIDIGIIIWICERKLSNKGGDFAKDFLHGVWDAVWWAAVTMTTVGYGDKTPKSIIGRLIGIIWLFMSATLMSGFTALLTSSLGANNDIATQKIVVLNGTLEASFVEDKRGEKVVVNTVEEAFNQAASLHVAGALLETNVVAHYLPKQSDEYLNILYSVNREQNVTFMYMKDQLQHISDANAFIECMEGQLYPLAERTRPGLMTEKEKTFTEVLSGSAYSVAVFHYLYASTGILIFIGICVDIWNKLKTKKGLKKIVSIQNGNKDTDIEMSLAKQQPDDLKMILQDLKTIKETLKQLTSNNLKEIEL